MVGVIALDRSLELRRSVDGGTRVEVVAAVDADGDLIISGHDTGTAPNELLGSKSYDHWVVVAGEDKDFVLLHLLRERFSQAPAPSAEFMAWLQEHQIAHEVGSSAGEHRGNARLNPLGRRRNGTRGSNRTRAGP